ncbi:hypothetical protein ASPZODRAFT_130823 [Penicilliopsis zonata CBS 506.65]|uniref:Uncharacterized protein n=1 Tax=Penicilliopsis zonata CBS 506.65 TaxID=1073090 RepID=A0A1L9SN70_9EURO|nr:hypothetical protein ASPZODRAFT_130823 [Penicilliopsis zonata CBS 506.65]OJJ48709.1 hypothetical protein ASPZODRAFT_130823 [Penicilliopsis zonata CBS 506.65]
MRTVDVMQYPVINSYPPRQFAMGWYQTFSATGSGGKKLRPSWGRPTQRPTFMASPAC